MSLKSCRIPFESLVDYHEGRATPATSERIRVHLEADCPNCRAGLNWLSNATTQIHEAQRVQVPASMLNRAYNIFRERMPVPARPAWQALLQFDSRSNLAFAGARGQVEGAFQLRFSTEAHDITLFEEPLLDGAWYVIGQVLPKEGDAVLVPQAVLLTAQDGGTQTFAPQAEEFYLPAIAAGFYGITIQLEDGEIVLPRVGIGMQETP